MPASPTLDSGNNPSTTLDEVFCTRRCRLTPRFGIETEAGTTQSHEINYTQIEMRSDSETRQITPAMEIEVNDVRYEVIAAPDRNNIERQTVRFNCTELN